MWARCWLISLTATLTALGPAQAQDVNLAEAALVDSCVRNELTMELDGKISVQQDGKPREFPLKATARHVYMERFTKAGEACADEGARVYSVAEGAITFGDQTVKRALRADSFLVAQRGKNRVVSYSLKSPLTRDEMELTEHFDTLALPGLLPGKEVAVGATWKLPNNVVAALCALDGLTEHDLTCKLEKVADAVAHVKVSGSVGGIEVGAQVKLLVNAHFEFDTGDKRIVALEWKQSDQRQQGPVSPALSADVVIKLKRSAIAEPAVLNKYATVPIVANPPASLTSIVSRDHKDRFELLHPRDWHVVSPATSNETVLRLINERGEFIAQATVSPWKTMADKAPSLQEFADEMAKVPGWTVQNVIEQKQLDPKVCRVTASGELDGVKTVQSFYLVVNGGDLTIVTFSMLPDKVEALTGRDLELVRSLTFPTPAGGAP